MLHSMMPQPGEEFIARQRANGQEARHNPCRCTSVEPAKVHARDSAGDERTFERCTWLFFPTQPVHDAGKEETPDGDTGN